MGPNQAIFLLSSLVLLVSTQIDEKSSSPCTDPKASNGVRQEGCLVQTCVSGTTVESLAKECVDLITEKVDKIVDEKLAGRGIECSIESKSVSEDGKYKIPGIIVAGGSWQKKVKLIKPDTKEVCDLPDLPSYFSWPSINLFGGTPIMCSSWFGSPGKARMKNETEVRYFAPVVSCVQLSPASKDAQWTIFTDKISNKRDCVSLATPDGILLMGGNTRRGVNLVKPDGTYEWDVFQLKRMIDRGCGIEDEGSLIITGGGNNGRGDPIASKLVDRYNRQGFVENLPEMNQERTDHGCGFYHRDGKKILVVAGGYHGHYEKMSSTETHVLGSSSWTYLQFSLPKPLRIPASVSINNKIYILVGDGKEYDANLEVFQFDGEKWEETQKFRWWRLDDRYQGNRAIAVDLATSGFDQFCN